MNLTGREVLDGHRGLAIEEWQQVLVEIDTQPERCQGAQLVEGLLRLLAAGCASQLSRHRVEGLPSAEEDQLRVGRGGHPVRETCGLAAQREVGTRRSVGRGRVEGRPAGYLQAVRSRDEGQRRAVVARCQR